MPVKTAKPVSVLNIVNYDKKVLYELKHPSSGDGLGVILELVSQGSDVAKEMARKQFAQPDIAQKMNGSKRIEFAERMTEERLASCIVAWDFNGNVLFEGDEREPEFNQENKLKLVQCPWIFDQLNKQVNDVQNFTIA